jgi:GntR family transcriptional regulator, transcriptional repressor for pyruvate dehydrogenase complex
MADATSDVLGRFDIGPAREKRRGAADDAIATIKSMIIDGRLGPHDRMPSEQDLAAALRVSRPTIREATRALVALNILEARHGDGTYVTSLVPELLAEPIDFLLRVDSESIGLLAETREVLETGIAALAATRASAEDIERLTVTVDEYSRHLSNVAKCIELDQRFHREIADAAKSPILTSMLSTVSMLAAKSRQNTARSGATRKQSDVDHRALLKAIAAHDPDGARQHMAAHLAHVVPAKSRRPTK